jgi:hypothetical protein
MYLYISADIVLISQSLQILICSILFYYGSSFALLRIALLKLNIYLSHRECFMLSVSHLYLHYLSQATINRTRFTHGLHYRTTTISDEGLHSSPFSMQQWQALSPLLLNALACLLIITSMLHYR